MLLKVKVDIGKYSKCSLVFYKINFFSRDSLLNFKKKLYMIGIGLYYVKEW